MPKPLALIEVDELLAQPERLVATLRVAARSPVSSRGGSPVARFRAWLARRGDASIDLARRFAPPPPLAPATGKR